ncbi:MaoC family dehydratase N-terminal domain-containing protein [Aminobacter sp. AP02]|uniref:FAS1-like dehydratase domain-containing protein n=1 Tax=Aminobacter sp. AP02 TaxID=2135737 RepID=UPI000D6B50E4|nr:MaoC family dehydratase N-terminal domain-containing protein [Aminobacter sp. AP02]PWK61279.1 MaoC dehydratase-like protein [Aminobacter sp. AP02]
MALLNDEILKFVGLQSPEVEAPHPVEASEVRRYAQATMDDDPHYMEGQGADRPIAPLLFPTHMFRTPFGSPDVLTERAGDPDFDGGVALSSRGLPDLPTRNLVRLNGGMRVDFYDHARHGERVCMRSRYASITEKEGGKGPLMIVVIDTDYYTSDQRPLLRVQNTGIYR